MRESVMSLRPRGLLKVNKTRRKKVATMESFRSSVNNTNITDVTSDFGPKLPRSTKPRLTRSLLNHLLDDYDSCRRPGHPGGPTVIRADINIRSMGPVSEVDMTYSMEAYFRQTWLDTRLRFNGPIKEMAVGIKMLKEIWKPDTHFYNGQGTHIHTMTMPNKLIRIRCDGTVLYSIRMTIRATCKMRLEYYPVDEQHCPLVFGSYAYSQKDVVYEWKLNNGRSIATARDLQFSQFELIDYLATQINVSNTLGVNSALHVMFHLRRHTGYYLIQVYFPCTLVVVLSWVSFWINREATADRIGLGVTCFLTLATMSMDSRNALPRVSYATALDYFNLLCFVFIIGTMLEFAAVHYFTKLDSGEEIAPDSDSDKDDDDGDDDQKKIAEHTTRTKQTFGNKPPYVTRTAARVTKQIHHQRESCLRTFLHCFRGDVRYRRHLQETSHGVNSVSKIDRISRVLFPSCFTAILIFYWRAYTN